MWTDLQGMKQRDFSFLLHACYNSIEYTYVIIETVISQCGMRSVIFSKSPCEVFIFCRYQLLNKNHEMKCMSIRSTVTWKRLIDYWSWRGGGQ